MDELLGIEIPHSTEAEQAVLGSILIDASCMPDVTAMLRPEDFFSDVNQQIYETICTMFNEGQVVDPVTVMDKVKGDDVVKLKDIQRYILELWQITPTAANVKEYARIVQENAIRRGVQAASTDAAKLAAEGFDLSEVDGALQKAQEVIAGRASVEAVSLRDATLNFYNELSERQKSGAALRGLPTGFAELDKYLGGLQPGNMIILAARPGMGKSALALNIAVKTSSLSKKTVLFFSLEMSVSELTERLYASAAEIDLSVLRNANLSKKDWDKLDASASTVTGIDVRVIETPSLTADEISGICRRTKPALVIIDHVGLIKPVGRQSNRREAMDAISRSIKCLAKSLQIPILALAQLNRQVLDRRNKTPVLSDLRESGALEQDSDVVLFIDRPAYYQKKASENEASLVIAKNRHGQTGKIPLLWFGAHQKFTDDWTADMGKNVDQLKDDPVQEELPF